MSQHPSLRSSDRDKQHRSVLKRHERIKILKDKEKWNEEDSVFGLPKVKIIKFKIKKEKAAAVEAGAEAAAAPGQEGQPAAGGAAKPAASGAKGQPAAAGKPAAKDAGKTGEGKK